MRKSIDRIAVLLALLALAPLLGADQRDARSGILLLAHGGRADWNNSIKELAAKVDIRQQVEIAFGMASRPSIQSAIDRLVARGATAIVAVPLFVSSHSSVVTSTEYLLGLRAEAAKELAIFAKMNHGNHGASDAHGAPAADAESPITPPVSTRMTSALNRHPVVGAILASRARAISHDPAREAVILVAHGPVSDHDNRRWLEDMSVSADRVRAEIKFRSVDYLTVRDDAPTPIRDAAAADLCALVSRRTAEGSRVLIVPQLLSYGGIERGIVKRLEGLNYVMAERGTCTG